MRIRAIARDHLRGGRGSCRAELPPRKRLGGSLALLLPICAWVLILLLLSVGCGRSDSQAKREIVLYSSVDEPYLAPLLQRFEQQTSIHVRLITDTEANKS